MIGWRAVLGDMRWGGRTRVTMGDFSVHGGRRRCCSCADAGDFLLSFPRQCCSVTSFLAEESRLAARHCSNNNWLVTRARNAPRDALYADAARTIRAPTGGLSCPRLTAWGGDGPLGARTATGPAMARDSTAPGATCWTDGWTQNPAALPGRSVLHSRLIFLQWDCVSDANVT